MKQLNCTTTSLDWELPVIIKKREEIMAFNHI